MEKLKHFSHEHSLILNENGAKEDVACYGCSKPITAGTSVYCCDYSADCHEVFLHKSCAELPERIDYPLHPEHNLVLCLPEDTYYCDVCWLDCKWFIYSCIQCDYSACLTCSSDQQRNFRHQGHNQHTFTLVQRRASFLCNACGDEDADFSYICNSCPFWMHQSCASAPAFLNCKLDEHPLVLAYSVPKQYGTFLNMCSICGKVVYRNFWLYYCAYCRFFGHIKCCTSIDRYSVLMLRSPQNEDDEADSDDPNFVCFPMSNELSLEAIVQRFIKANSLTDNTNIAPNHINHWVHERHPLILVDDELKKNNTDEMMNRNDDQMSCDGCAQPILSTHIFYGCVQCSFFLHKFCAELPSKVKHSLHPKHKLAICKYKKPNFYIACNLCSCSCNGMFYYCKICKFYLDIRCALLPTTIKHKAHRHPVCQLEVSRRVCEACDCYFSGTSFGCEICDDFHLDRFCAFMPSMVRHRWDPHPIPLVYPPVKDHPDIFYCEICEEEINPNLWLYHCPPCDQSFHPQCLKPYYRYSNIKFGANDIKAENHPHSLTFVGMEKHKAPPYACSICGDDIRDGVPVLKCEPCHFRLCMDCGPKT